MPGDNAQVWFRAVVAQLRDSWRPDSSWDSVVELRNALQRTLDSVVDQRRSSRPTRRHACSCCGGEMRPVISVRAVLLALGRFGIEPDEKMRQLDKEWGKHRALHRLDMFGRQKEMEDTRRAGERAEVRAGHGNHGLHR